MKKRLILAAVAVSLSLVPFAQATTLTGDCTSPAVDANPPASGSLPNSVCDALATPAGTINFVTLTYKFDMTLQLGSLVGSVNMGHQVNSAALSFFNNLPTPTLVSNVSHPVTVTMPSMACPSAACTAALAALASGVTIRTDFANATGSVSGVSSDFAWVVDYDSGARSGDVPEPSSLVLIGAGLVALGIIRKRG